MKTLEPGRPFIACPSRSQAGSMLLYGTVSLGPKPARQRGGVGATPPQKEVWEDVWVFPIP